MSTKASENWQMISEGTALLHYWKDNVKLCNTVKHNIQQILPPVNTKNDLDHCTACGILIIDKLK